MLSGSHRTARRARRTFVSIVLASGTLVAAVMGAQPAAALACVPVPTAIDHNYTALVGVPLNVYASPNGLLVGAAPAGGVTVETSWQTSPPPFFPSDDVSFIGNAAIRYGTPGGGRNRQGGFTYTPDPKTPFAGNDEFSFTVMDGCGDESAVQTAHIKVVAFVVGWTYAAIMNKPLVVPVGSGFLSHDKGVDPTSLVFDGTSAHGGSVDDGNKSNGSFVYTPPAGFSGSDSFHYTVQDINNDYTYSATVHINVGKLPAAPTKVHATAGNGSASVTFTPPNSGSFPITGYTVVASPGGRTASGSARPVTISGLTPGATYTFRVRASNAIGSGPYSAASNAVTIPRRSGYWMLASNGAVFGFGQVTTSANHAGSAVAIAPRRDGSGYWTVDAVGNVSNFGAAGGHGGNPPLQLGESVSTISATPSGNGYWLFTNRGRAFPYGDAAFHGDMSGQSLNGPVIASVATPTGRGYYMVASDGGVFSFGDAHFHGSTGGIHLNRPVVGISPTPDNRGYWLVASDGGVFAFNAPFRGSMGGANLARPVNGLVSYGNGYLMVASDGGVFDFSNRSFLGSLASNSPPAPIIGIAAVG